MNTTARRRSSSLPMPLWLQGFVELSLLALVSYLLLALLLVAVWYTKGFNSGSLSQAFSLAGHIWLLVHGVPLEMSIPQQGIYAPVEGTMSLMPLGLSLIPFYLCYRSGRRLARASYEGQFWQPLLAGLGAYGLVGAGISLFSRSDDFSTWPLAAALLPLWLLALGLVAGAYAESRSLAAMIGVNAAEWVKHFSQYSRWAGSYLWALVRSSLLAFLAYCAGGALLLSLTLFWHWDRVVALYQTLQAGAVGGLALTLLQLGLLPNFLIFAMAWSSGAGFALGTGTRVDLTGTEVGPLPTFPILGALPYAQEPWGYLALALPLAAGALGGWWFFREGENHLDEWFSLKIRFRFISWPLSTLSLGLLTFIPSFLLLLALGWASNGSLGVGRFRELGPDPLLFACYGAGLLAAGSMLGLGLAHLLVRDTSGELERFAVEDQADPPAQLPAASRLRLRPVPQQLEQQGKEAKELQADPNPPEPEQAEGADQAEGVEPAEQAGPLEAADSALEDQDQPEASQEGKVRPFQPLIRRPQSRRGRRP